MPGTLYLVATPIGNLEDITLRALRVLREADWIACEDTRQTGKLLAHFGIAKPMVSYHEHNEPRGARNWWAKLAGGANSGAGLRRGHAAGVRSWLPAGRPRRSPQESPWCRFPAPRRLWARWAGAGLPTDAFRFCGFLPTETRQRRKTLEELREEACTLVFYEDAAPDSGCAGGRIGGDGARPVVVARELTKLHEEFLRGTAEEVRAIGRAAVGERGDYAADRRKAHPSPQTRRSIRPCGSWKRRACRAWTRSSRWLASAASPSARSTNRLEVGQAIRSPVVWRGTAPLRARRVLPLRSTPQSSR